MTNPLPEAIRACLDTAHELDVLAHDHRRQAGQLLARLKHDHPFAWFDMTGIDQPTGEMLIARAAGIEKR